MLLDLVSQEVRQKLSALRVALRMHLVGRGLALVLIAAVAAVFLSFVVDRQLDMSISQRALIMAAVGAAVAYVLWRFLLRPLRAPMDSAELALVLEQYYPQLDDRLISTLDFSATDMAALGASEALIRKVADQTNALAGELEPSAPIESTETWKRLGVAGGAMLVLMTFSILKADVMGPWFLRNILFRNVPYPQETYLSVTGEPASFKVARGGSLKVIAVADENHIVPDEVVFHTEFASLSGLQHDTIAREGDSNVFVRTFEDITEPFKFRVTGNDHTTKWQEVSVVDPPELVKLGFRVNYPEYMNRPVSAVTAEHGVLSVPPGSRISLAGEANKQLTAGQLWLAEQPVGTLSVTSLPDGDGHESPRGVKGALDVPISPEQSSLTLRMELTDTLGITNPRGAVYVVRIEPDAAPLIHLGRKGVRGDITARAIIPMIIQVQDDHGVKALKATVATTAAPAPTTAPAEAPPPATTQPIKQEYPVPDVPAGRRELTVEYGLDIEPLKLSVGQSVEVRVVASDSLPESFGGPNQSLSAVQTFRIVTDEDLLAELLRRQKEIRDAFAVVVELQAAARDRMRAVRDRLEPGGKVDVALGRKLSLTAADQLRIAAQCAVAARQMQEVLDEIVANRVGTDAQKRNLAEKIIQPLEVISKKPMTSVAAAISGASKKTDADDLRQFAETTSDILDGLHSRLEEILQQMQKEHSRQFLVSWLTKILGDSKEVQRIIEEYMESEKGTLWDENSLD